MLFCNRYRKTLEVYVLYDLIVNIIINFNKEKINEKTS